MSLENEALAREHTRTLLEDARQARLARAVVRERGMARKAERLARRAERLARRAERHAARARVLQERAFA